MTYVCLCDCYSDGWCTWNKPLYKNISSKRIEFYHLKYLYWHETNNMYWYICSALNNDHDTTIRTWYDNHHVARRTRRSRAVQFKGNVSIIHRIFKNRTLRSYYFHIIIVFSINSKLKMCTSWLCAVQYFKRSSINTVKTHDVTYPVISFHHSNIRV